MGILRPRSPHAVRRNPCHGGNGMFVHRNRSKQGFSLVELVVVVAIVLVLAAIAVPNMMNVIGNSRLRAAASSLSGLLQNSRMQAVKQNRTMTVHFTTV